MTVAPWPASPTPADIPSTPPGNYTTGPATSAVASSGGSSTVAESTVLPAGRNGYEFDTYDDPSEREEVFFLWKLIMWVFAKFFQIKLPEGGYCSTYREWHIAWEGIWAGIKAPQLADIPECPPRWMDECLYYRGHATVSNVLKIYGFAGVASGFGTLTGWMFVNGITPADILKLIGIS